MFEKIIENALQKILGDYVEGLDGESLKLGVWSGDATVENLKLKPDAIMKLGLPFLVKFSYLGKLVLKVPWKSIQSSPLQATLDELIIEVEPLDEKDWKFGAVNPEEVLQQIDNFKASLIAQLQEKQQQKDGMMDRLIIKIVENIQVKINNIHLRVNVKKQGCAFGVVLQTMTCLTINEKGQETFIDRTSEANKNLPLIKQLKISQFGVYWNTQAEQLDEQRLKNIFNVSGQDYLFLLDLNAQLTQPPINSKDLPSYSLEFNLNQIDIKLSKFQLQQIITFSEYLRSYRVQKKLYIKSKMPKEVPKQLLDRFLQLYQQVPLDKKAPQGLSQNDQKEILQILSQISFEDLEVHLKNLIKSLQLEEMKKNALKKKEQSQGGFFGLFAKKKPQEDINLNEEEQNEIIQFLDRNFSSDVQQQQVKTYYVKALLLKGSISIINQRKQHKDQFSIIFQQLTFEYVRSGLINTELRDLLLEFNFDSQNHQLLQKNQEVLMEQEAFMTINLIDNLIKLKTRSSTIQFNPNIIPVLQDYIALNVNADIISGVQDAADQAIIDIKQNVKQKEVSKYNYLIETDSLLIKLPIKDNQYWLINPGKLNVKGQSKDYEIKLSNIGFSHFVGEKQRSIIQDFNIEAKIALIPNSIKCSISIQEIGISINQDSYLKIIDISQCFQPSISLENYKNQSLVKQTVNLLEQNKQYLTQNCTKLGPLFIREGLNWQKYICVLKDPYLYGFKSVKDDYPVFYKWIRHSTFEQQPLDEYGMHILEISNFENTFQISSNKESQLKDWRDHFEKDADQSAIVQKQPDDTSFSIQLELQQVSIRLIDLGEKPFFLLQTNTLSINFNTAPNKMDIKLILKGIYAEDFLNKYEDPSLKYILDQGDVGGELVSISLIRYTDVNKLFIDLSFGNIRVNFKCEVFAYILQFFLTDSPAQEQIQNIPIAETPTDNPDMDEYLDAEQQLERIQIKVHINQIHVIMVNQITKLKYFDLGFNNCNSQLIIYTNSKSFDLTLGNLFLRDLTNYPNTLFEEMEWNLIKPQNLLYNSDEKQSLIEFKLILRDDLSKLAKQNNNITMDIQLRLSQIILSYIQQPVLRIIDFCKITVADTFIKPNSFKVKGSQIRPNQLNRQQSKIIIEPEQKPPQNLDSILKNPYRMKIQVEINNPQIMVKSLLSDDILILDLGKIIVTNQKKLQNDIWREIYYIQLSNFTLNQKNDYIIDNCDLKLDVNMPDQVDLYKFKKQDVSQTIEIDSKFNPVLLRITNQHLNSINKCLAYNINLDDHFDDFMTCNWDKSFQGIDNVQQQQIIEQVKDQRKPTSKVFVHYTLNLTRISILVLENENPLIKLQIIESNLDFKLLRNSKKEILFTLQNFKGSQFVKQQNFYKQIPLIGTHSIKNIKPNNIMMDQESEISGNQSVTMVRLEFNLNPTNKTKHFKVDLKLEGFSFVVWLKELLQISLKFQFQQLKELENKFQGWTEKMAQQVEKEIDDQSQQTEQQINVIISELLFLIPKSLDERHVIVAKTNLQFIFNKYELSTIPQLLQIMSERNLDLRDIQQRNYDFKAHLTIQDLEVFMSNKEQIFETANILSCPKRQIISPIKTTVNINHQLFLHEFLEHFIDTYFIQIIIQDIHIRVTFIDILILREFMNTLMPQKQGDAQQIEKQQQTIEKNQTQKIDGKQYKAEIKLSILEIEFLNDVDNNYQKLVKFLLSDNSFTYKLTDVVTEIKYLGFIKLAYYNSAVQEWEPIIEPTDFEIIYTIDETTSKKLFIFFHYLNINFSTKMFHVLYDASMLLKQKLSQNQKNQVNYEEETLLNYGVYNLSGFVMLVEPQIDKNINLIVENNQIQYFTMSGQNQRVNIQVSYGHINYQIQNVTFRKNKCFSHQVKNEIILQKNIVDEGTNKKIAVFTGKYLINNMTHNLLTILFDNQEYNLSPYIESQNYKLSKSQLAVPYQNLNQYLSVEFNGVRAKIHKLDYISKHLNQHIEIQFSNRDYISMFSQKDPTLEGRFVINFLPIYRFINLLPFPIKYVIYSDKCEATRLQVLGYQQQTDIYEVKRDALNGIQLHLEGYERSIIIDLNINQNQGYQSRVNIQGQQWQGSDGGQNEIILEVDTSKYQQTGLKFISIYSSTYIRNFTPYELIYYQGEENCHIVGGQIQGTKNRIMLLKQTQDNPNLLLASRNSPRVLSQNRAQLKLLGRSQTEVFVQEQNKFKLIPIFVRSEVKVIQGIIQKIITLRPKIILVNQTNHVINIFNGISSWALDKNSREPLQLIFVNVIPQLGNEFQYKFNIQIDNFEKSCDLEFIGPNQIFFQLKLQKDPMVRVYFQIDVIDFNDQLFAIFQQAAQPPYRIINKSKYFKLYIGMIPTTLEENQHVDFAYDNPYASRVILVNFLSLIPQLNSEQKKIETEKLLNHKMLKFHSNNLVYWIRLKIYIQGNTKLIVFSDGNDIVQKQFRNMNIQNLEFNEDEEIMKFEDKQIKSNYQIIIPKFNLSVIENYKSKPFELLTLTINGFETFVVENLNKKLLLQIIFKELQLDNNETQAIFPVIIKSQLKQNILVSLIIEYDLRAEVIGVFDSIRLEILPLQITLDDRFLNAILEYTKIIDQIISDCEYKQKIEQKEIMWQDCVLPPPDRPTYIKSLIINTLNLQVSFFIAGDKKGSKITSLIGAIGLKLVNIDEANLKFSGLKMIDIYDNFNQLTKKIVFHYKDQALSQLPILLGSLAILGNPLKLFKSVTNGLVDFVEKPMEGISKGPIELYQGIQKGTSSLVSNTVAGTFDTVKTITGAVSSGLTQITLDDDYMRDRQRKSQQEKPQNISEGVQEGSKSLFKGLYKGLTGVVTKPFEGAQQGGAKGFAKGLWQGTSGLVMKPVVGVIDVVTMTSEGIKNQIGPNKSVKSQRQRQIRPFYDGQYYDTYNSVDALGFELMNTLQKSKYQNHEFFRAAEFINQSSYLFIITNRIVILFDTDNEQQQWAIKLEQIKKIEIIERSLIRIFSKKPKSSWKNNSLIMINGNQMEPVYKYLNEAYMRYYQL